MAPKMKRMSHLCLFNLLVITQYVRVIEMTPICGRTGASSSSSLATKNTDKIYFVDPQEDIYTEEINGTIVSCFADRTIINATSAAAKKSEMMELNLELKLVNTSSFFEIANDIQ